MSYHIFSLFLSAPLDRNVCTHSYSLVWYDWPQWEAFIDWMALSGVNMALAMTGQEEVQYKVFVQLGLSDTDIRHWFNGPAFLTWSRGQNGALSLTTNTQDN
jgi:alpha-N-acetylglucosaminidase